MNFYSNLYFQIRAQFELTLKKMIQASICSFSISITFVFLIREIERLCEARSCPFKEDKSSKSSDKEEIFIRWDRSLYPLSLRKYAGQPYE
jgi:hypothetical protein